MNRKYTGIEKDCSTCEFNFGNVCGSKYYGEDMGSAIEKVKKIGSCSDWSISLNAFCEFEDNQSYKKNM